MLLIFPYFIKPDNELVETIETFFNNDRYEGLCLKWSIVKESEKESRLSLDIKGRDRIVSSWNMA